MTVLYWFFEGGAAFLEWYLLLKLLRTVLKENDSEDRWKKEISTAAGLSVITLFLNQIQLFSVLNFIIEIVVFVVIQKLLFKRKTFQCLIIVPVYIVAMAVIEYLVLIYLKYLYNLDAEALSTLSYERLTAIVLSKGMLVLVIELICYVLKRKEQMHIRNKIGINIAIVLLAFFPVGLLFDYNKYGYMSLSGFWGIILCVSAVVLLIKYLVQDTEKYNQELELKVQEAKNQVLEKSMQELENSFNMWKKSVHDYKHAILYMEMLLENDRVAELKEYLLKQDSRLADSAVYYKTGNSMLDVIINTKLKTMNDKGILFSASTNLSEEFFVKDEDFAILLGNLMDNAIEAAEKSQKPYIIFDMEQSEKLIELEIINSCREDENLSFKTTKKKTAFHGIGLKSVADIVKKYHGEMNREADEGEVIVNITLLFVENGNYDTK